MGEILECGGGSARLGKFKGVGYLGGQGKIYYFKWWWDVLVV